MDIVSSKSLEKFSDQFKSPSRQIGVDETKSLTGLHMVLRVK
jgi:hypothetical protein